MIRLAILWGVLAGTTVASECPVLDRFETTGAEMAVPIRLVLYAPDAATANRASRAALIEIRRLNGIFSDYDATSESRRLGDRAKVDSPQRVSDDLFRVLMAAEGFSRRSGGAFDVTVGPLTHLWRRTRRRGVLPPSERLADARSRVGFELVRLDPKEKTVSLGKQGMRFDFGGIAKGYAADAALATLRKHGINRALVEAGGDIALGDPPPGKQGWRIGVARLHEAGSPLPAVVASNCGVSTSGDTAQHVEIDGRRYSHVLDPRTGMALTDHCSVTVVTPNAMTSDALVSAVSVLGPTEGIRLIESLPDTAALVVRGAGRSQEVRRSSRFGQFVVEPPAR